MPLGRGVSQAPGRYEKRFLNFLLLSAQLVRSRPQRVRVAQVVFFGFASIFFLLVVLFFKSTMEGFWKCLPFSKLGWRETSKDYEVQSYLVIRKPHTFVVWLATWDAVTNHKIHWRIFLFEKKQLVKNGDFLNHLELVSTVARKRVATCVCLNPFCCHGWGKFSKRIFKIPRWTQGERLVYYYIYIHVHCVWDSPSSTDHQGYHVFSRGLL